MPDLRRLVSPPSGGFFADIGNQFRLVLKLMSDPRVSPLVKLLPVGSLLYLISPFDFAIPVVDDAAVLWIASTIFVELCPPDVVAEHRTALEPKPKKESGIKIDEGDIVDADYKDKGSDQA
jgi:hypothetical protein